VKEKSGDKFEQNLDRSIVVMMGLLRKTINTKQRDLTSKSLVENTDANALNSNDSYGIGLSFGQFLDLSKSKIGINIQSAVSSDEPYTAYAFFLGIVSV
jgi:hypothetical protein